MKRIISAGIAAIVYVVVLPLVALAQEVSDLEGSDLGPPGGPIVGGTGGTIGGTGGSAFTGAEIAGLVFLAIGLMAVGIAIVVLSRRRTASRIEA